jgi:Fic family protein
MKQFFLWKSLRWKTMDPDAAVIYSCQVLHKFLHIRPFMDGNGRIGRLLFLLALQSHGYPPVVFYNTHGVNRKQYLDALASAQDGVPHLLYDIVISVLEGILRRAANT